MPYTRPVAVCLLFAFIAAPAVQAQRTEYKGKSLDQWVDLLQANDPEARGDAVGAVGQFGIDAAEHVPALMLALTDYSAYVRRQAAWSLGRAGPFALSAVPVLEGAMNDEQPYVRAAAGGAIGMIGPLAASATPALTAALADADPQVRAGAAAGLAGIGPASRPALAPLTTALADDYYPVRSAAARALGSMGPAAASAVPALTKALSDEQSSVRVQAVDALGDIGPPAASAVPGLLTILEREEEDLQLRAISALGGIGAGAKAAVSELQRLAAEDHPMAENLRRRARSALRRINMPLSQRSFSGLVFSEPSSAEIRVLESLRLFGGLRVIAIADARQAAPWDLEPGDIIVAVAGRGLDEPVELQRAVESAAGAGECPMLVLRAGVVLIKQAPAGGRAAPAGGATQPAATDDEAPRLYRPGAPQ